uniref:Uncharacterized protein n=1 Tax=uncultured prokaryote TaxID=198431 RepID=A0A0H5Q2D6_9ZZZZ|nr:hypothetical protein [uncultured prokaryote]
MYTMKISAEQWFDSVHVTAVLTEHSDDGSMPRVTTMRRTGKLPLDPSGVPTEDQRAFLTEAVLLIRDVTLGSLSKPWM